MRLIDYDQQIFVPIIDDKLGTSYEVRMTIAQFFDRFLEEFEPQFVDAIPVKQLEEYDDEFDNSIPLSCALRDWHENRF